MTTTDREAFEAECPQKIYLLDMGEDMPVWCEDSSPDNDDRFSVEYVRAESAREIERLQRVVDAKAALLKEASIQISNFGCDGSHIKSGCHACVFQHQLAAAEKESAK